VLIQYEETPVIDVYPYVKPINATKIESFWLLNLVVHIVATVFWSCSYVSIVKDGESAYL
jgi:hypothetical protein